MGVAAFIYDQYTKRTASPVVPAQQVVQAEAMQKSLPAPQKSPDNRDKNGDNIRYDRLFFRNPKLSA